MKYIEKHPDKVIAYEKQLREQQIDMRSLSNPAVHQTWKGKEVYEYAQGLSEFKNMETQLLLDQGGVCCYCGCRIPHPTGIPPYVREHVTPRESSRELAGEYSNLLLSCRGENDALGPNSLKDISHRKKNFFFHCDKHKGAKPLINSPLQSDCDSHFSYSISGKVSEDGNIEGPDIKVLNLNCEYLKTRRKAAIDSFIYDSDNNMLSSDELQRLATALSQRDANGNYHEYFFVVANVAKTLFKQPK